MCPQIACMRGCIITLVAFVWFYGVVSLFHKAILQTQFFIFKNVFHFKIVNFVVLSQMVPSNWGKLRGVWTWTANTESERVCTLTKLGTQVCWREMSSLGVLGVPLILFDHTPTPLLLYGMVGNWPFHIPPLHHYDRFPPGGNITGGNMLGNQHHHNQNCNRHNHDDYQHKPNNQRTDYPQEGEHLSDSSSVWSRHQMFIENYRKNHWNPWTACGS